LLLITNKASEEQGKEIIQIVYGNKERLFALLQAQFVDINAKMMEEKELCTRITRGGIFSNTRN
jgi:hypothetical protein